MSNIIHFPYPNTPKLDQMTGQTQAMRFRIIQTLLGEQGRIPDDPTRILLLSKILDSIDKTAFMERKLDQEQASELNQNQIAKMLTEALKSISVSAQTPSEEHDVLDRYQAQPGEMENGLSPLTWETLFPPPEDRAD